ncbi:MAG: hypothetical protein HDT27_01100 [Subdoligranulum sp.]|nr:hypothetical protein [Subdoligranulum sp.]
MVKIVRTAGRFAGAAGCSADIADRFVRFTDRVAGVETRFAGYFTLPLHLGKQVWKDCGVWIMRDLLGLTFPNSVLGFRE